MDIVEKRAVGLLVLEVINSNPNGDPDRESDPRQRLDGYGEISPVSFKRKLRDLVENKEGPVWKELSKELNLNPEEFEILESRQTELKIIRSLGEREFIQRYWDGRIFGNTELEKRRKIPVKTGVVQFGMGISVAPIHIERLTTTNPPVQGDKTRGMAPLGYRVVQHGVYCMPFFVNPSVAHKSGCTTKDIELMLKLIPYAYSHTRSYIRPQVEIRHAWYAEHKSPLGSFSDQEFIAAMTPKKKNEPDRPSICWDDYLVPCELPESLNHKVEKFIDLVEQI